jgi:hypothetical protein
LTELKTLKNKNNMNYKDIDSAGAPEVTCTVEVM